MATPLTFRELTPAEVYRDLQLRILEAFCRRADTPNSLRVISKDAGVNEHFRGRYAVSLAASLARELDDKRADWHIQTGQGWLVVTARQYGRMTWEEVEELLKAP